MTHIYLLPVRRYLQISPFMIQQFLFRRTLNRCTCLSEFLIVYKTGLLHKREIYTLFKILK